MSNEIWVPAYGYEGIYEVSNLGRVRNKKGHIFKSHDNGFGYYRVRLTKDKVKKQVRINRLVYASFNGEIPNKLFVNHIDEAKKNNALANLNLMTRKENNNYGTRTERAAKSQYKQVLCYDKNTMEFICEYSSPTVAAETLGCKRTPIYVAIRENRSYFGFIWKYKDNE